MDKQEKLSTFHVSREVVYFGVLAIAFAQYHALSVAAEIQAVRGVICFVGTAAGAG